MGTHKYAAAPHEMRHETASVLLPNDVAAANCNNLRTNKNSSSHPLDYNYVWIQILLHRQHRDESEKTMQAILTLAQHTSEWAGSTRFIRFMPNTPSVVGQTTSVISLGGTASEEDGVLIGSLFGAIGKTWRANEKMFDDVTGLSGSDPTYIFLAIEALSDGVVAAGLPQDLAAGLAAQTVLGAAAMVVNNGKHQLEVPLLLRLNYRRVDFVGL